MNLLAAEVEAGMLLHESDRNRLTNEARRLVLAEADMRQVMAAVDALLGETLNGDLCRALETAVIVCYARAFTTSNTVGPLTEDWTPADPVERRFHDEIMRLRDKVYAHTDKIGARDIADAGEMLGLGQVAFVEGWHPLDRKVLPAIRALADAQDGRLKTRIEAINRELSAAVPPTA